MEFSHLKFLYNRCNPAESLDPGDGRNVDIDSYVDPASDTPARGLRWAERLCKRILLSNKPTLHLITGPSGCGKSTEFNRAARTLGTEEGGRFLTVLIDATEVLDLTSTIDASDVLAAIMSETEKRLLRMEGKDVSEAYKSGYVARFQNWIRNTDVELKSLNFGRSISGTNVDLVLEMKTNPDLRARVQKIIASHLPFFLGEVAKEIKDFQARAQKLGYKDIVVIFDSLEKLRGISTSYADVLTSAERLFGAGAPYLRLPVHVIYTVPSTLFARGVREISFMPMVKLRARDGSVFETGLEACRQIAKSRIPENDLAEILGSERWQERLDRLIWSTGGYPRDLVRLLQSTLEGSSFPLSERALDRILAEMRNEYHHLIPSDAFEWLARVHKEKNVSPDTSSPRDRHFTDVLFSTNAVLAYRNDEDWFDLHPAVLELPGVKAALQKLAP